MIEIQHVKGKNKGKIILYALSTCVWCKKTKQFLKDLGVTYDYIFVDTLEDDDQDEIMSQIEKWNPRGSFPTIVINDEVCIVGFKEEEIKKALKI